ncbi:hypothetical protein C8J56DRAFT_971476 [Mycena floridula]|nr:hypothetical protein C8J56DRAFT_837943 [Mycena floridula]KAJ7577284.1 hypothetical protein C8J56DRAFT_971476 [Mycena floridula]
MASDRYELLPPDDDDYSTSELSDEEQEIRRPLRRQPSPPRDPRFPNGIDPRFIQPTPAAWKRVALLAFVVALFWVAISMRAGQSRKNMIVHASRYSKEHKFRPAASPVVTETLSDGRVRVRGAQPTASTTPTPIPKVKAKKRSAKGTKRSTHNKKKKAGKR